MINRLAIASLFFFFPVLTQAALETYTLNTHGQEVVTKRIFSLGAAEETIFFDAFFDVYRDVADDVLGITIDKKTWLKDAFEDGKAELQFDAERKIFAFTAQIEGQEFPVALVAFNQTENPGEVYIQYLAVSPSCTRQGIGAELCFLCRKVFPETQRIILAARKINEPALSFYKALGFTEYNEVPNGFDPAYFVGLEYLVPST
jgi:ribosomal protein S18 acetylase RimI-like enzyme